MRFAWASIGAILVGSIISNSQTTTQPRAQEFTLEGLQTTEQGNPEYASYFCSLPAQDKREYSVVAGYRELIHPSSWAS